MDYSSGFDTGADNKVDFEPGEQRGARRYTSLIRAAKLVCSAGEYICVIRDVSATGISLRTFHRLPDDRTITLELQNGESYSLTQVRRADCEASYQFEKPVEVERLIRETWRYPKRQLRLNIAIPLQMTSLTIGGEAQTVNLSQQGARVKCDTSFAIDQRLRVFGPSFRETRATVRWRRDGYYGLVFDSTFSLREFALMAASVQCPSLLEETPNAA